MTILFDFLIYKEKTIFSAYFFVNKVLYLHKDSFPLNRERYYNSVIWDS